MVRDKSLTTKFAKNIISAIHMGNRCHSNRKHIERRLQLFKLPLVYQAPLWQHCISHERQLKRKLGCVTDAVRWQILVVPSPVSKNQVDLRKTELHVLSWQNGKLLNWFFQLNQVCTILFKIFHQSITRSREHLKILLTFIN